MSPEQASGERQIDGRTDIYSLASVLYEMLTGQPPFTGRSAHLMLVARMTSTARPLRELREAVSPELDAVVARALERNPSDRFATAAEFGSALATCVRAARV